MSYLVQLCAVYRHEKYNYLPTIYHKHLPYSLYAMIGWNFHVRREW